LASNFIKISFIKKIFEKLRIKHKKIKIIEYLKKIFKLLISSINPTKNTTVIPAERHAKSLREIDIKSLKLKKIMNMKNKIFKYKKIPPLIRTGSLCIFLSLGKS
tara:strand:- start:1190 stop:1504 length:315 start_codon:yes stop_codon:yes gene_type:complete